MDGDLRPGASGVSDSGDGRSNRRSTVGHTGILYGVALGGQVVPMSFRDVVVYG